MCARSLSLLALTLVACQGSRAEPGDLLDDTGSVDAVDLRQDFPDAPEGGLQLVTPEMVIPAFTEKQFCFFDTWEGDAAVSFAEAWQPEYGHHAQLMGTNADEDDYPDGSTLDCTAQDAMPMSNLEPLYVPTPVERGHISMELPEGFAVKIRDGQRIVIQSHYLNTSADPILVQDVINLGFMDVEEVETWTAPFAHTDTDLSIPPGDQHSVQFDCTFSEERSLLYVTGHMHEYGFSYGVDHLKNDESSERIYEVETWTPDDRDTAPVNVYEPGDFTVAAGESFRTTCTWFNTEDHDLEFPEEMCATVGMVYPAKVPEICTP